MKYILVTGGVISGIGKGVIASSIGTILKSSNLHVTSIKIDPYINIDAGTFSPYEHVVPHITDAIQEWVMRQALIPVDEDGIEPEVCVIELGGTVGDIESMPFVEAFRQFQFKVRRENFCNIHVSLVPQPSATGEQKTKPTQNSVRELRGLGLSPDLVVCRCSTPLDTSVKEKISMFCHVEPQQVICVHDVSSIYRVPLLLEEQGVVDYFRQRLDLPIGRQPRRLLMKWKEMADRYERLLESCSIALVGKYTKFSDSYASVIKALEHSALAINHRLEIKYIDSADLEQETLQEEPVRYHEAWQKLCSSEGILVPGGFGVRGTEGKIQAIAWARKQKKPFLDANSTEFNPKTSHPVVIDMPEHNPGQMGGTMRLGKRRTIFHSQNSIMKKLYGGHEYVEERHRHRYEVNPELRRELEVRGLKFVGQDTEGERMEIVELEDHPYFVGVQYHPEFLSRPIKPSPPYFGLLLASVGRLSQYIERGCRLSPR
uniref:Isoform 2 of CTP synthase 1-A n=1 Tax=Xenopus laevis TaxID=8355 RepID=Q5XHA8-2